MQNTNVVDIFRIEEQMQAISFGDETGDYSSIYNDFSQQQYQSVDSKRFNHKLNIEETYAEIDVEGNVKKYEDFKLKTSMIEAAKCSDNALPEYAVIDLNKKRAARTKRLVTSDNVKDRIYEDVGEVSDERINNSEDDKDIYELVREIINVVKKN